MLRCADLAKVVLLGAMDSMGIRKEQLAEEQTWVDAAMCGYIRVPEKKTEGDFSFGNKIFTLNFVI